MDDIVALAGGFDKEKVGNREEVMHPGGGGGLQYSFGVGILTNLDEQGLYRSAMLFALRSRGGVSRWSCVLAALVFCARVRGTDIIGIQPAALDQPRINAVVRYGGTADPLYADLFGSRAFNIQAFFDTGASGVLISNNTASMLGELYNPGVQKATYNGKSVYFEDVGVAGADRFEVSVPLHISLAPLTPHVDEQIALAEETLDANIRAGRPAYQGVDLSAYSQTSGPLRAQIGPFISDDPNQPNDNPLLSDLDVFGMPLMRGKVVVMDPKPVENLISGNYESGLLIKTYVYNPGTAFKPATADSDPGIPPTTRTVKLSYGSFDPFTRTGTADTPTQTTLDPIPPADLPNYQPKLDHNPFIGPNPVNPAGDTTPPVKITFNGTSANGSFLLDTGAAASMISTALAQQVKVRYVPGTEGGSDPKLETFDPANPSAPGTLVPNQFQLTIGGIGGDKKVAGFFLSSMLLKTTQGGASDTDPRHFRFVDAPVLVTDIKLLNDKGTSTPADDTVLTLDGIFGMNNLVASIFFAEATPLPILADLTPGAFDWIAFDEPNGLLQLRPRLNGDANRDGVVNFADLVAVAQHYGAAPDGMPWEQGDFNGDNVIDFADLVALAQHYGAADLGAGDAIDLPHYDFDFGLGAPVPEPATGLLLAAGTLLLGLRRDGRRMI